VAGSCITSNKPICTLAATRRFGRLALLSVKDDKNGWFAFHGERELPLAELDVILMRKDPPFDMEYIYTTYLLELAETAGVLVVNKPAQPARRQRKILRPELSAVLPADAGRPGAARLKAFLGEHARHRGQAAGRHGWRIGVPPATDDPNRNVILETLTAHGRRLTMAQRYIPEVTAGDKRILLIDGEPVPYALARIPQTGETRANLAAGGRGEGRAAHRARPLDLRAGGSEPTRNGSCCSSVWT
jgi:glutathione synthase